MRYLEFCRCGAAVPARYARQIIGCGPDGRSCARPVELTAAEILDGQAQLELETLLSWQALGVNIDVAGDQLLERNHSQGEGAR